MHDVTVGEKDANQDFDKLLLSCRAGDDSSFNMLAQYYLPLIRRICSNFYIKGYDYQDLIQEGLIGLHKAVKVYNAHKGSSFTTIAKLCIRRNVLQIIRSNNAKKRLIHNESYHLHDESPCGKSYIELIPNGASEPLMQIVDKENKERLYHYIASCLTPMERRIFELYIRGLSYKDISLSLGFSSKAVDNAIRRSVKKLKAAVRVQNDENIDFFMSNYTF